MPFDDERPQPKIRLADFCNPTCQIRAPDVSRDYRVATGVAPDALWWTLRFTPQNPLRPTSSLPWPRRVLSSRRVLGAPAPLTPRHRPCFVSMLPTPPGRSRPHPPPQCMTTTASSVRGRLPLARSSSRAFHESLSRSLPDWIPISTSLRLRRFCPPPTRPRPLTSAATEARLLGQTPLTRFCNLSTRNSDTPTCVSSSHVTALSRYLVV